MRLTEMLRLVWLNLMQNKSRVLLTSVGITAGSATILLVLAIGRGGQLEVAEQFQNLNAGAIDITCDTADSSGGSLRQNSGRGGSGMPGGGPSGSGMSGGRPSGGMPGGGMPDFGPFPGFGGEGENNQETVILKESDLEEIRSLVPGIADGTISFSAKAEVEGGSLEESISYTIAGVKDNYAQISNLSLAVGEFLTEENEEGKEKVCVLGGDVAEEIFGNCYDACDSTIYIDNRPYVVAGVLEKMGTVSSGISPDGAVFLPYSTTIKYLTGSGISPTVTVIAEEVEQVGDIIDRIEEILTENYPNTKFTLSDAGTKMEAASQSNDTLQILLVAMAAIVFIIGGIGIMNVLFVSVKERTNEIGILKAIGYCRKDILTEFLLEAVCISMVGAVLGVFLGLGVTPVLERFSVRVELSVSGVMLSLVFGGLTGSLFGFYPAYQASGLIPVEALNHE